MRRILPLFFSFLVCLGLNAQSNVTFQVDLSTYTGSFTTAYVSGSFNGWSGDANPLEDADMDGIYTATVSMPDGPTEFKYQLDGWVVGEEFTPGGTCTLTTGEFTNRFVEVAGDTDTGVSCWNSCNACGATMGTDGNITVSVDMSQYTGTFGTVSLGGAFNGWSGDANPMTDDDMDGVWTTTVLMPAGANEYKFILDNWATSEELTPGSSCTLTTGEFTNRLLMVDGDAEVAAVCYESCMACGNGVDPVDGNVTLSVDMSLYVGTFTTISVGGAFNGWSGDANPMTDDDMDGVWTTTILMPAGPNEYKFVVDNWTDSETLMEGSSCTLTTEGFTNRYIEVDGDMEVPTVCYASCNVCGEEVEGMVTLSVDMSLYAGTFTTVFLSGDFNGWSGDGNPMSDDDMDGIWTTTVLMPAGSNQYKFTLDNWTDQELWTEGVACTTPTGEFINRIITVNGDAEVPAVCWNECSPCNASVDGMITLNVDMNEYAGTFTTVFVSGAFNGWAGDVNPMEDADMDGVWTTTIMMGAGPNEYKFQVDAWVDQEILEVGSSCTLTTGEFTNRLIQVNGDATIPTVCWASCAACGIVPPGGGDITLSVDMNEYAGAFTNVYLGGTFNGWSGDANQMSDADADGVYTITVTMPAGDNEYKFLVDNWADSEQLTEGSSCTLTTDGFTNRIITVAGDATIDPVCWASCEACTVNTFDIVDSELIFNLQPTLVQDFTVITFNAEMNNARQLDITDALGRVVYTNKVAATTEQLNVNTSNWANGTYFVRVLVDNKLATRRMMVAK